jgi:hypothetical protein
VPAVVVVELDAVLSTLELELALTEPLLALETELERLLPLPERPLLLSLLLPRWLLLPLPE